MTDIVSVDADLGLADTQVAKAGNILSIQVGDLEYATDLGIDLAFFLSPDFKFQNSSFKAYIIQRLAESGINVSTLTETIESLFTTYNINLSPDQSASGLIAR